MSKLIAACFSDNTNTSRVKRLLKKGKGANLNELSSLRHVIASLNLDLVPGGPYLEPDGKDILWTPLTIAIYKNRVPIAKLLLKQPSIDINQANGWMDTPLIVASRNSRGENVSLVQILLSKDADVNARNNTGATSLYMASAYGNIEVARLLLDNGADIDLFTTDNRTPIAIAADGEYCSDSSLEMVKFLLSRGADLDTNKDNSIITPFMTAVCRSNLTVVTFLLSKGVDINQCDSRGNNALQEITWSEQPIQIPILKLLLANGINVNHLDDKKGHGTALYSASAEGDLEVVQILISHGADVNLVAKSGESPLHFASEMGHLEIVTCLLDNGANIEQQTVGGVTPLYMASAKNRRAIVKVLISRGANVHTADDEGSTPLMIASQCGHTKMCRLLIKNGALVKTSKTSPDGEITNAEFYAKGNGHDDTSKLLLRKARKCALCGVTAAEKEKKSLDKCSGCNSVFYCCKEHQRTHWKNGHKAECKKIQAENKLKEQSKN